MNNEIITRSESPEGIIKNFNQDFLLKKIVRIILFLLLLVWSFGFSINSLLPNSEAAALYPLLKKIYSAVCHQNENKLVNMSSGSFLVCARCSGIYIGALIISLISLFSLNQFNLKKKFLIILALPLIIDVLFSSLEVYSYLKIVSFSTGLFFGSALFIYILFPLEKFFLNSDGQDAL